MTLASVTYASLQRSATEKFLRDFHGIPPVTSYPVTEYTQMRARVTALNLETSPDGHSLCLHLFLEALVERDFGTVRTYLAAGLDLSDLAHRMRARLRAGHELLDRIEFMFFDIEPTLVDPSETVIRRLLLPRLPDDFRVNHSVQRGEGQRSMVSIAPLPTAAQYDRPEDRRVFWDIYRRRLTACSGDPTDPRLTYEILDGLPFVHVAVNRNALTLMRELLEHHQSQPEVITEMRDSTGRTPLFFADSAEMAQLLLDSGADPNAVDDDGATALFGKRQLIFNATNTLAEHPRADLNLQDLQQRTASHWAIEARNLRLWQALVENRADFTVTNEAGLAPLALIRQLIGRDLHGIDNVRVGTSFANDRMDDIEIRKEMAELLSDLPFVPPSHEGKLYTKITVGIHPMLLERFKFYIDWGWDLNTPNSEGVRPLHLAIKAWHELEARRIGNPWTEIIPHMIAKGADPQLLDRDGKTPRQLAESLGIDGTDIETLFGTAEPAIEGSPLKRARGDGAAQG